MLLSDSSPKILLSSRSLVWKSRRATTHLKSVPFPWILSTSRTFLWLSTAKSSSSWSLCSTMLMMMNSMEILVKMMKSCRWSAPYFRWPRTSHQQHLKRPLLHPREPSKHRFLRRIRSLQRTCQEEELVRVRLPRLVASNHKFLQLTETWDPDKVLIDQALLLWCRPSEIRRERP